MGQSGAWKGFARALEGEAEILAFDLPGHGRSPDWVPGTDQHRIATDWATDLLQPGMHVVGHSYGATVALRLAVENRDAIKSLTLIEPTFLAAARDAAPELWAEHIEELTQYEAAAERDDFESAAQAFNASWGDGTPWSQIPEKIRAHMARCIPFILGTRPFVMEDYAGLLKPGVLETLEMPVALVQGERTHPLIKTAISSLKERIKGCKLEVILGAGHMAPISHAENVAAVTRDLIETVQGRLETERTG
jgi:pimeloyl-ACP methyl ester carboxylesterase